MLTRTLFATTAHGQIPVPIQLHAPAEGDRCWECAYAIGWPDGERGGVVRGFDSMQAVYLTMQRIAVELYGSPYHASGSLRWDKPGGGYGFPMPKNGYNELVGEDRIAQIPD